MSFLHIDMAQVVEIFPFSKTRTYLLYIVSIMGADVLATQGARTSATMILTFLNQIIQSQHIRVNNVLANERLQNWSQPFYTHSHSVELNIAGHFITSLNLIYVFIPLGAQPLPQ